MAVFTPKKIKEIAAILGLTPSKRLGQNFLIDENVLGKIIAAAELKKDDTVLEVGPGLGILTKELAIGALKVLAIEKDKKLVSYLNEAIKHYNHREAGSRMRDNITIVEGDFLEIDLSKLNFGKGYKVVANLPYFITSAAIRKIMEADPRSSMAVLMVQKEVAERVCARAGDMNLLALSVQYYGTPKLLFKVSKGSFWPAPKVDSAVIKIIMDPSSPSLRRAGKGQEENFFRLARIGFSSPRKQLQNNLAAGLHISKEKAIELLNRAEINPKARPEELGVEDWERLAQMS